MSPISAAIVYASTELIPGTVQSKRDGVAVVGAEPAQLALAVADLTGDASAATASEIANAVRS